MRLFHGGIQAVEQPNLSVCRANTDFGRGFYTTTHQKQAEQWSRIVQRRNPEAHQGIVSIFEFDEKQLQSSSLVVRNFNGVSEDCLDFVFFNRRGNSEQFFDIVLGPVANDSLYATLQVFEQGIISKQEAIAHLKTHTLVDQISFHSPKAISTLQFVEQIQLM
ncbi:MAG: DUF3990 domain-containing protein [Bacteroidales bacterium]